MADPTSLPDLLKLAPYPGFTGALAYLVWILGSGRYVRREELERERARADKLQEFVTGEMVPALTRATDALREAQVASEVRRRTR